MYDIIGDIHGYADELESLLRKLGYQEQSGIYRHPDRKVIFVGDFIDRGPRIDRVLQIARNMVESGTALAVLGNHELNAIAYATPDPLNSGEYMRPHTEKNRKQHRATIDQLTQSGDLQSHLDWFRTLPIALDLGELRIVHACWDDEHIARIEKYRPRSEPISDTFIEQAYRKGTELYESMEATAKGKEAKLPNGYTFGDKEGKLRCEIRVQWYRSSLGETFASYALQSDPIVCDHPLPESVHRAARPYPSDAPPIFFGHYWLCAKTPMPLASNVACLDYSVAKDGFLCAYRWTGEQQLLEKHFVS